MKPARDASSIEGIAARQEALLDRSRQAAVERQHERGQLSARERIQLLLDDGEPLLEIGSLAKAVTPDVDAPADGVIVGLGRVHGALSAVIAYDFTVLGGSQGATSHAKTSRIMKIAKQFSAPVFVLAEGGGARTLDLSHMHSGARKQGDFAWLAELSGKVPLIGVGMGRVFAGHAILLAECDVVILTDQSAMGVAGPPLVKASTGQDLTPEEIGGASIHRDAGGVERVVGTDQEAIVEARAYARYFVERRCEWTEPRGLGDAFPDVEEEGCLDMHGIVDALVDENSRFDLRPDWRQEVITTLARIGGHSVGIIATVPNVDGGRLTAGGCDKIARFVQLCGSFWLPVVILVDSCGMTDDSDPAVQNLYRHAARIPAALDRARVLMRVVAGRADGVSQILLGGFGTLLEGPLHVMWPRATIRGLGSSVDAEPVTALRAAEEFATDDVIDPRQTRSIALRLLAALPEVGGAASGLAISPW